MAELDFYYKGKKVNEDIANWRDLEIDVSWENDGNQPVLRSENLEFVGDLAKKIHSHNLSGLSGGVGIFEAPEFRIEACGSAVKLFSGGINTADCNTLYECDKIIAPLRYDQIDYFRDRSSSFSFPYLASIGRISPADFINVPYVINSIPDGFNIFISAISLFVMLKELEEMVEKTAVIIPNLLAKGASAVGALVNAPFPSPILAAALVGEVVVSVLGITLYIIYLLFIIKAIITLLQMLFDNIIQPVKYKKGMKVADLMKEGASYLGLRLVSSLYNGGKNNNDVIVPAKSSYNNSPTKTQDLFGKKFIKNKNYDEINNNDAVGYPDWTFAQLIQAE